MVPGPLTLRSVVAAPPVRVFAAFPMVKTSPDETVETTGVIFRNNAAAAAEFRALGAVLSRVQVGTDLPWILRRAELVLRHERNY